MTYVYIISTHLTEILDSYWSRAGKYIPILTCESLINERLVISNPSIDHNWEIMTDLGHYFPLNNDIKLWTNRNAVILVVLRSSNIIPQYRLTDISVSQYWGYIGLYFPALDQ